MDLLKIDRDKATKPRSPDQNNGDGDGASEPLPPIPVYRIDLSLPPHLRYVTVATDFAPKIRSLVHLFDDILTSISPNPTIKRIIEFFASLLLFRLFSSEETQELRGIARASGLKMYLLVALNVLLDSMLGCTSGGVMVAPKKGASGVEKRRMLHFRTLDWGMDPLRQALVVLEFVRSDSADPDEVLARTVTYAGFVGVLTGVRKDLSLSLNFRGQRECTARQLSIHKLLVLFGLRRSIASVLRNLVIEPPQSTGSASAPAPTLSEITKKLETTKASPCYLVLSSGDETAMMEKDLYSARTTVSDEFIIVTNWDCDCEGPPSSLDPKPATMAGKAMDEIVAFGDERKGTLEEKFKGVKKRQEKKWKEDHAGELDGFKVMVKESTVLSWIRTYPVWNELTHFGCIMDAKKGQINWVERGDL